ncbi:MAG: hypothetical protein U9R79_11670 [Armatimonadota bacterium]|nr:hypothetical protein [Armatimonadota bacterium]
MKIERDPHGRSRIPWWRSPGALILWALLAAAIVVLLGDPAMDALMRLLRDLELSN